MLDRYILKHEGYPESIGELLIDYEEDSYDFMKNRNYKGPLPFFLQFEDSLLSTSEKIKMWVLSRSPEQEYEFIDALIEKAGLEAYDPYGFFKYNNGKFIPDRFYVELIRD